MRENKLERSLRRFPMCCNSRINRITRITRITRIASQYCYENCTGMKHSNEKLEIYAGVCGIVDNMFPLSSIVLYFIYVYFRLVVHIKIKKLNYNYKIINSYV